MQIEVIGCYGSAAKNKYLSTYLLKDESGYIALDAGSLCNILDEKQLLIHSAIITHAHLDHWRDLPILAYNQAMPQNVVNLPGFTVYGTGNVLSAINSDGFAGKSWVDFPQIEIDGRKIVSFKPVEIENTFQIGKYKFTAFEVSHPVCKESGAVSYLIEDDHSAVLYTGDMDFAGKDFWKSFQGNEKLKAVIIECSYPNRFEETCAIPFHHLTPQMLSEQFSLLNRNDVTFYATHFFPRYEDEIKGEIESLNQSGFNVKVLEQSSIIKL